MKVLFDQDIRHQQNISKRNLALIVLLGTKWMNILPRDSEMRTTIDNARHGDVVDIPVRYS